MSDEWQTELKNWKKRFPLHMRLLYFMIGYPPKPIGLSEESWKQWKGRFNGREYDWTKHSGTGDSSSKSAREE
jgi:hypothetical protein